MESLSFIFIVFARMVTRATVDDGTTTVSVALKVRVVPKAVQMMVANATAALAVVSFVLDVRVVRIGRGDSVGAPCCSDVVRADFPMKLGVEGE